MRELMDNLHPNIQLYLLVALPVFFGAILQEVFLVIKRLYFKKEKYTTPDFIAAVIFVVFAPALWPVSLPYILYKFFFKSPKTNEN